MTSSGFPISTHKSVLYEFTEKEDIQRPFFQTVKEGPCHAPRFQSTVLVANASFTSQTTFPHRKAAEEDASKVALEGLLAKYSEQDISTVSSEHLHASYAQHNVSRVGDDGFSFILEVWFYVIFNKFFSR